MGIYFGKLLDSTLWGTKTHKILMVGLDSAGKTTILYQLKLGREVVTIPTIGYNVETIELGNINLSVWDLGCWTNNPFWIYYLPDAVGLIFVVDLSDNERMHEARDKLHAVLSDDKNNVCLLVLANKMDNPEAMSISEVTVALDLHEVQGRSYFVQECSARTGQGLMEGLKWLASAIGQKYT